MNDPMTFDVMEVVMQQLFESAYRPNSITMHVWDAYRSGVVRRLPRKLKKQIKMSIDRARRIEEDCKKIAKLYGV